VGKLNQDIVKKKFNASKNALPPQDGLKFKHFCAEATEKFFGAK
jgi:hypothetical protein